MRLLAAALTLIVAVALVIGLTGSSNARRPAPPLAPAPLHGAPTTLAGLRGEPVIVDFFASWCAPCVGEAPTIARAASALAGRAHLVGVDWTDSRRYALAFVRRFGWRFPVLFDPNGTSGYAYGIQGLPTAFVLDSRGRIVVRLLGPQTVANLERAVAQARTA